MTHNPKDDEGVMRKAAEMGAKAQEAWGGEGVTQRKQLIQNDISNSGPDMSKHIGGNQSLQEWESPSCPVCSGTGHDPKTLVTCSSCHGSGKDDTGLPIRKPDTLQSVSACSCDYGELDGNGRPELDIGCAVHGTPDAPLSQGEEYDPEGLNSIIADRDAALAERDKLATDIAELKALVPEAKEELRALRLQRDKLVERVSVLEAALKPFAEFPSHGIYGGPLCCAKGIYEDGTDEDEARHRGRIDPSHFARARTALRQAQHDPKDRQSEGGE